VNPRVRAVMTKEFREYRRNRLIILTMAILPVVLTLIPLVTLLAIRGKAPHSAITAVVGQATLFFFISPLMLPTTIAAYAVIGEREQGTLEPVLATPVTDRELLLGKTIAATIPGIVLSWALFIVFAVIVRLAARPVVVHEFWKAWRFAAVGFLTPVLAAFSILICLAISARSNDIRVAQQLSALVMLPALAGVAALSFQAVTPSVKLFAIVAAVLAVVDLRGWRAVVRLFDRERLLSRYGG